MKIRPLGAELFHADERTNGRTDMTKLTVAFRSLVLRKLLIKMFSLSKKKFIYVMNKGYERYANNTPSLSA